MCDSARDALARQHYDGGDGGADELERPMMVAR